MSQQIYLQMRSKDHNEEAKNIFNFANFIVFFLITVYQFCGNYLICTKRIEHRT